MLDISVTTIDRNDDGRQFGANRRDQVGHLDKLEITMRIIAAAKPRRREETIEYRRQKLIANVEEQIELAQLAIQDKPLVLERKRGHSVTTVRPRIWWKDVGDDHIVTQIRYNKLPLRLDGRGTSIEVGRLKKLPTILRTVIRATKAGELDTAIRQAARKSRP